MKRLLIICLILSALTGCEKSDELVRCSTPPPVSLIDFARRHGPITQEFTFDPTRLQTIRTAGGAWIKVSPHSLVLTNGAIPTGLVTLRYQEIYSASAMVLANLPTMSGHVPLQSGGEFNLQFFAGTERLRVRRGKQIQLETPLKARGTADVIPVMQQWYWNGHAPEGGTWVAAGNASIATLIQRYDPKGRLIPVYTAALDSALVPDTLGWLSRHTYAYPASAGARTLVSLDVGGAPAAAIAFLLPTDRNGAFRTHWNAQTQLTELGAIPLGTELQAVVLRVQDGRYYFGSQTATVTPGFVYRPVLKEMREEEIVSALSLL